MNINSYRVELTENESAKIYAQIEDNEMEIGIISDYKDSADLHEKVVNFLEQNDYKIVPLNTDEIYDQKADLKIVRAKMRKALIKLDNEDIPLSEREKLLPVYQQMCSASQVILNACKVELQLCQLQKNKK